MECKKLSNGVDMPYLGLGVYLSKKGEEVENAITYALKAGYRHIDTAAIYENEESVGNAIAKNHVDRKDIFLTTKVWNADQGYDKTLKAFDLSLEKLKTDYVDQYLVHWPGPNKNLRLETFKALIKLYEEKRVRSIGVSNFQTYHLDDLIDGCGFVPHANQVEMHPLLSQNDLLTYCNEKNITVVAWGPLLHRNLDKVPQIDEIANNYGKTRAQTILRWHLQRGVVVIPKSVNEGRIIENAQIFDFELSKEDMQKIDALNTNTRMGLDPDTCDLGF